MNVWDSIRYQGTFRKCLAFAVKCGLPVKVKKIDPVMKIGDAKSAWGFTLMHPTGRFRYRIGITMQFVTDWANENGNFSTKRDGALCSVIFHEILHTIPGCFNHGKEWRKWGKVLNDNGANVDLHPCGRHPPPWVACSSKP